MGQPAARFDPKLAEFAGDFDQSRGVSCRLLAAKACGGKADAP
jgi:hypothetical protein